MKPHDLTAARSQVYQSLSEVVAAFASPARLKIVQILAQSPRSVEELARETGESTANTSQHLQRLAKAKVVNCERHGLSRIYRVASPYVLSLWESFQNLGHELDPRLDIFEATLTDPTLKATLSVKAILREVRAGKATLIDVREEKESEATPVKGALSLPLSCLSRSKGPKELNIPKSKPIYALCRGRYCSLATQAVRILRGWGCTAYRLKESSFQLNLLLNGGAV